MRFTSNSRELWYRLDVHLADLVEEAGRIELVHELDQVAQFCLGAESKRDPRELVAAGAGSLETSVVSRKLTRVGQAAEPVSDTANGRATAREAGPAAATRQGVWRRGPPPAAASPCPRFRWSACLFGDQLVVRSGVAGEEKEPQPHQADKPQGQARQDFFATLQLHGFSPFSGRTEASKEHA